MAAIPQGSTAQGAAPGAMPGRLLWRCRRGMKELDVMLERFARRALPGAASTELRAFERLLALPDPLLAGYLLGEERPSDAELQALTARIRDLCHGSPVC
ncbi:MAG TPA: succinate dehydrogenase assembly factor 2 [Steroidobacteraceae bacterium]|nr:succinate dehydrogenase assembly factor 2 [Steroidobacteraceae bacterium]